MVSKSPGDLNDLAIFAAVVETGGFTAAAERLGVTKAKVSVEVRRLEAALGVSLFTRTTRRVVPTDAGRRLHQACAPLRAGWPRRWNRSAATTARLQER
jgi:DNA-binding transcriptional LysR family regulator